VESTGDFEQASDGERLDSLLFGIQEWGALLMGPHGGAPTRRSPEPAGRACVERWVAVWAATSEGHFVPASPQSGRTPKWVNEPAFWRAAVRRGSGAASWGRLQGGS